MRTAPGLLADERVTASWVETTVGNLSWLTRRLPEDSCETDEAPDSLDLMSPMTPADSLATSPVRAKETTNPATAWFAPL